MKGNVRHIMKEPKILKAKLSGIESLYAYHCLTAKKYGDFRTVIDVGANVGKFSKAVRYFFPDSYIIAFEPIPQLFNNLNNVGINKILSFALSDEDKDNVEFKYNRNKDSTSTFMKLDKDNREINNEAFEIIKVNQKRFDSLNLPIQRPCFLKIDTEGYEFKVLEGFGQRLNEIDVIQIEVNFQDNFEGQRPVSELIAYLEKFGFKSFVQRSKRFDNGKLNRCELFFIKNG